MDHWHHGCCQQCHLERPAVKPAMQPTSRRLWLSHKWFSSQKKARIVVPGLVSVLGQLTKSTLPPLSKSPWWWKESRWSPTRPIHCIPYLSKSENKADWPLAVPGQLQDKLNRGHTCYIWRWVCHRLLVIVWALITVHSDRQWLHWEKLRNNTFLTWTIAFLSKYSSLILIPPCTMVLQGVPKKF